MEQQVKLLPRVAPFSMPEKGNCYFYHCIDFPHGETASGDWDIRGIFQQYIANYPLKGKTVLDVGTATGFLAFNAEIEGATVTSLDMRSVAEMDRIPFVGNAYHTDRSTWNLQNDILHEKLRNGFWYSWHTLNSKVSVSYTPIRDLPYYNERFDVVIAGAIIEHLADPVSCIGAICSLAKEAVIIAFTPVEISGEQVMRTMNPWSDAKIDATWWLLSEGLYRRVFANLGFEIELFPAKGYFTLDNYREEYRYTIVARRVAPLGAQPLSLPNHNLKKPRTGAWRKLFRLSGAA